MAASERVILSARDAWAVANDADMAENVRTASMMVKKSPVEMVIDSWGCAEVLGPAISEWAMGMVVEGTGGTDGTRAGGTRAVVA